MEALPAEDTQVTGSQSPMGIGGGVVAAWAAGGCFEREPQITRTARIHSFVLFVPIRGLFFSSLTRRVSGCGAKTQKLQVLHLSAHVTLVHARVHQRHVPNDLTNGSRALGEEHDAGMIPTEILES